ncbi:MAG: hypothetical protein ACODAF_02850 [Actinomycetota bacterium]
MDSRASYLAVIGEREALAWVLRESRMAFPATRRSEVDRLAVGDELFLLTTRGCFHNPSRDRTRVVGHTVVASPVVLLDPPVELAGRTFPRGCDLQLTALAPYLTGVELGALVPRLDAFPDAATWSIRLRRPLVALSRRDADLVAERLGTVAGPPQSSLEGYLDRIKPVGRS